MCFCGQSTHLVSVIIPIYQVEQYIERCVNSVINQTYKNLEIILVDDGSTDASGEIADKYSQIDDRVIVMHKDNGGLSSARNSGLDIANGEYVLFVDSDDWIDAEMVEYLVKLLQQYPQAQIAQCDRLKVDKEKKPVKNNKKKECVVLKNKKEMLESFFRINGEQSNTGVWKNLIKRSLLEEFRFVDTLNEDVEACYEWYTRAENVIVTNRKLYYYFENAVGITKSSFKLKDMEYLLVWDRIVARTEEEYPEYMEYAMNGRSRANFTLLAKMYVRGFDRTNNELVEIRKYLKRAVRKDCVKLLRWKMPMSRKILLILLII